MVIQKSSDGVGTPGKCVIFLHSVVLTSHSSEVLERFWPQIKDKFLGNMFNFMSYYKYFEHPKSPKILRCRTEIVLMGRSGAGWASHFLQCTYNLNSIQFPFVFYQFSPQFLNSGKKYFDHI